MSAGVVIVIVAFALALVVVVVGQRLRGNTAAETIVRCRKDHLFTTYSMSLANFQRCPVGNHWSIVIPVNELTLTPSEIKLARSHRATRTR